MPELFELNDDERTKTRTVRRSIFALLDQSTSDAFEMMKKEERGWALV